MDGGTVGVVLGAGVGLALIIEGLLPFLSPPAWRILITQVQQLNDGQIRFFGLCCVAVGGLILTALL